MQIKLDHGLLVRSVFGHSAVKVNRFNVQTGRLFVRALAINNASSTAAKLTNLQGNTTDYGDIVYEVMRNRSPENGSLTVFEVNKYLDLIAEHFKQNQRSSKC